MKTWSYGLVALLALLAVAVTPLAQASTLEAKSRTYTYSCGYYSSVVADLVIDYRNESLPWGVIVELIYGFQGHRVTYESGEYREIRLEWQWEDRMVVDATSPHTWTANLEVPVGYRSRSEFFDGVNFVYRIIYPDGRVEFDNGGESPWGFYSVPVDKRGPCTSDSEPLPSFESREVSTTERY